MLALSATICSQEWQLWPMDSQCVKQRIDFHAILCSLWITNFALCILLSTVILHALKGYCLVLSNADEENLPESKLRLHYIGSLSPSSTEEEQVFQRAPTLHGIVILLYEFRYLFFNYRVLLHCWMGREDVERHSLTAAFIRIVWTSKHKKMCMACFFFLFRLVIS